MSNLPLFPASVVGSLPRPDSVRVLLGRDDSQTQLDAAIRDAVALQENAGIDILTDGEWRRASYIGVIAQLAHGFELDTNPADGRPWTIVVDKLAPRNSGFIAAEVRYLKTITDRQIKATLPAPALLGERMWDAGKSSAAYPTPESFVADCVPILRREVELLREEGVAVVQIDDPHLCLFVDPEVRAKYENADHAATWSTRSLRASMISSLPSTFAVAPAHAPVARPPMRGAIPPSSANSTA